MQSRAVSCPPQSPWPSTVDSGVSSRHGLSRGRAQRACSATGERGDLDGGLGSGAGVSGELPPSSSQQGRRLLSTGGRGHLGGSKRARTRCRVFPTGRWWAPQSAQSTLSAARRGGQLHVGGRQRWRPPGDRPLEARGQGSWGRLSSLVSMLPLKKALSALHCCSPPAGLEQEPHGVK